MARPGGKSAARRTSASVEHPGPAAWRALLGRCPGIQAPLHSRLRGASLAPCENELAATDCHAVPLRRTGGSAPGSTGPGVLAVGLRRPTLNDRPGKDVVSTRERASAEEGAMAQPVRLVDENASVQHPLGARLPVIEHVPVRLHPSELEEVSRLAARIRDAAP